MSFEKTLRTTLQNNRYNLKKMIVRPPMGMIPIKMTLTDFTVAMRYTALMNDRMTDSIETWGDVKQ